MRILIVEDEALAARRLERMVRDILGDRVEQLSLRDALPDAEEFLHDKTVDLVLLDLNLNGQSGYDLLRSAAAASFKTIVVSANTDQAFRAFEFGVVDFVPKPYETERLRAALDRALPGGQSATPASLLAIRKHGKVELIALDEVGYFQGAGDYVEVHLKSGRMELHTKTLEQLESSLPAHFMRVHKSFIVDWRERRHIHVEGGGKYTLELKSGKQIPLGRAKYRELKEGA